MASTTPAVAGGTDAASLVKALAAAAGPGIDEDASLTQAATAHARELLADERAGTLERVRAAVVRQGLADAQVLPFASVGTNRLELTRAARRFAEERARGRGMTRIGVAIERSKDREALVVLFVRRLIELAPLPREARPPELEVRGRAARDAPRIRAFVTLPSGDVSELEVSRTGTKVGVKVPLPSPGRYAFELLTEGNIGPEVAALWHFAVPGPGAKDAPKELSAADDLAGAYALVEAARGAIERPPLPHQPSLELAASRHARAVCSTRLAAHVLPGGPAPDERARGAGWSGGVTENVALASSVSRAHQNILDSPSHRKNVLDPRAVAVGIGLERCEGPGPPTFALVQLFGLEPP